jgi:alpha-D-ribose 1-methylphosphonate 5-triphosphate synthase subunit PhnH
MSGLAFADPVFESQAAFRAILAAMARPGAIHPCGQGLEPPAPLSPAAAAAILARRPRNAALDRAVVFGDR